MITLGNDISKYQGDVNYDIFRNNTQFVIFKATEGVGYTDPKFSRNQNESRNVGLLCGYYHFCRPDLGNLPENEADYFLGVVGGLREGELIALDYECANQKQSDVDWCKKWLDRVYTKTGVRPFIYLNQSQMKFDWKTVVEGNYALWLASYTNDPNVNTGNTGNWPVMAMQQWTNAQTVPGVVGNVDGNVFFGSLDSLKKYGYVAPVTIPVDTTDYKALYEAVIKESQTKLLEMAQIHEEEKRLLTENIRILEELHKQDLSWADVADKYQKKLKAIVDIFATVNVQLAVESDVTVLVGTIHDYIANAEADRTFVTRVLSDTSLGSIEAVLEAIERLRLSETTITELEKQITKLQATITSLKNKQLTLWQFIINKYFTK